MKNQSKFRFIALATAVCASLTACRGAEQTEVSTETYTMVENNQNTTVVSDIYAAPVETVTWGDEEGAETPSVIKVSEFEDAGDFNEGHAIVRYNGMYYVIDTEGNIVLEFAEAPKDYIIYDGGLIILCNNNVMNLKGEIVADTAVHGHDMVRGIWHGYIVLRKKVETLERTGFDYCILNSDGSVHVEWAENPYYKFDEQSRKYDSSDADIYEINDSYIRIMYDDLASYGYYQTGIYNLKTGEYHATAKHDPTGRYNFINIYENKDFDAIAYYDYGYAAINDVEKTVEIYDHNNKLLEEINIGYIDFYDYNLSDVDSHTVWIYDTDRNKQNIIYDAYLRKQIIFEYDPENINYSGIYDCNREENLYYLELRNQQGSTFYAVADENGKYVVEPTTDKIKTCSNGVYTAGNEMYKNDGTLIYEGGVFGQYTDGYCLLKSEKCFVDINGNKLEVEIKTE